MAEAMTMARRPDAGDDATFDMATLMRLFGLFLLPSREMCLWPRIGLAMALGVVQGVTRGASATAATAE